jgi:ankyrin repeat protein
MPQTDQLMETSELLVQAAFDGNLDEVARLLKGGANVDAEGQCWNPLHAAIENEHSSCVRLLLAHGADVNLRAGHLTPLAHAVDISIDGNNQTGGRPCDEPIEIVQLLVCAGADIEPGLFMARRYQSHKLIQLLEVAELHGDRELHGDSADY